jgi:hypothetical protein
MFQLAVLIACQTPLKLGRPSAVRGISVGCANAEPKLPKLIRPAIIMAASGKFVGISDLAIGFSVVVVVFSLWR